MKFLVILALAFAVSSAAFTGSLLHETAPLVHQIKADLSQSLKARSSAEVGVQNAVLQGASDFINGMIGQIEGALEELQISAGTIAAQLIDATSQLQGFISSLGSQTGGVAGQLIGNIQNVLGNLLGNLFGGSQVNRASFDLSEDHLAMLQGLLDRPNVVLAMETSPLLRCLSTIIPPGVSVLDFVVHLNEDNNLNADYLLSQPAVASCIETQGGIVHIIQTSTIIAHLQNMVNQMGLQDMVHGIIIQVLGEETGAALIALLGQNNRGFFDLFSGLGSWTSGVWQSMTAGASSLMTMLSNVSSQAWASAAAKLAAIKEIALAHMSNGMANAQTLGINAAQQLANTIIPVYGQIGEVGQNVLAQLYGIYDNLELPQWIVDSFSQQ